MMDSIYLTYPVGKIKIEQRHIVRQVTLSLLNVKSFSGLLFKIFLLGGISSNI